MRDKQRAEFAAGPKLIQRDRPPWETNRQGNKRYDWEKYDLVVLPLVPGGIVYQHFNADSRKPARIIGAAPNFNDNLGVDMGVGFEQIESCPEYDAG